VINEFISSSRVVLLLFFFFHVFIAISVTIIASNSSTSSETSNSSQQNNGWSFEEQFKQVRQVCWSTIYDYNELLNKNALDKYLRICSVQSTYGLNCASQLFYFFFHFLQHSRFSHRFCKYLKKYWLRHASWNSLHIWRNTWTNTCNLTQQVSWQFQLWSPVVNPKLPLSYQITIFSLIEIHLFTSLKECLTQDSKGRVEKLHNLLLINEGYCNCRLIILINCFDHELTWNSIIYLIDITI